MTTFFLILLILAIFNIIIIVHELGHLLAAKWRGVKADRFQIWFGKPIFKVTVGGVQYGLGWIPAGGFVSLPQMAPMQAVEGKHSTSQKLPEIRAIDKIIVAFAGPLFSFTLAVVFALIVWKCGYPDQAITTRTIGYVKPGSPAAKAGLQPGDIITHINGKEMHFFQRDGDLSHSIITAIATSSGDKIRFTVLRNNKVKNITSGFEMPAKKKFYQRSALRKVGIGFNQKVVISSVLPYSPAAVAGLQPNDQITAINQQWPSIALLNQLVRNYRSGQPAIQLTVKNEQQVTRQVALVPRKPEQPVDSPASLGIAFQFDKSAFSVATVYPSVSEQISQSTQLIIKTIDLLTTADNDIGIEQLSSPVGILQHYYDLFTSGKDGWKLVLKFCVIFNINLAILNLLPLPVLDGGHIVIACIEGLSRRRIPLKVMEILHLVFAISLMGMMLYLATKDIGTNASRWFQSTSVEQPIKFAPINSEARPNSTL